VPGLPVIHTGPCLEHLPHRTGSPYRWERSIAAAGVTDAEIDRFLDVAQRLPELTPEELPGLSFTARHGLLASVDSPRGLF
jgi:hypothetical protein